MKWLLVSLLSIAIVLLLLSPLLLSAKSGHLTLLTVSGDQGGVADLFVNIKPGSGNVYIDTYPFTKLDTQISTRFAKEIACSMVEVDCRHLDFFYTIRAQSNLVGGPSAGGAIAALTLAVLKGLPLDPSVAMTGTINSGGIIGPVAGVRLKVLAAQDAGIKTVIIPRWQEQLINASQANESLDSLNSSSGLTPGIRVVKVVTLDQALGVITGNNFSEPVQSFTTPEDYDLLMERVALLLCNRTQRIIEQIQNQSNSSLAQAGQGFMESASQARNLSQWYSAASYCFSANMRFRELQFDSFSDQGLETVKSQVQYSIRERREMLANEPITTIGDLQTKAIVEVRLSESERYLEGNASSHEVAAAIERYYSAVVWSSFFDLPGQKAHLDQDHLMRSCESKIAEVSERMSYLQLIFGDAIRESDELVSARASHDGGQYSLCLFEASKAKAQTDLILMSASISDADFNASIDERLSVAKTLIYHESLKGRFPVMGYSYYEYASSLKNDDPYVAALYASYALELSDMSRYFPKDSPAFSIASINPFFYGVLLGVLAMLLVHILQK